MQAHTLPTRLAQRYELGSRIGRGGMADVWSAWDLRLQRQVALKTMRRELIDEPRMRRRFEAEGRAIARVVHPNVVQVYDRGEVDGLPFLVMEYAPGPTLAEVLGTGTMSAEEVRTIALGVACGLAAAHAEGVSHADVKPSNVLLVGGVPKLTDFGIARLDDAGDTDPAATVLGTPSYLAPERLTGSGATPRSDVYAAGVMMREMLTGSRTAEADDGGRAIEDPELAAIVDRATSTDPSERFEDGAALAAALTAESAAPPPGAGTARHDPTVAVLPVASPTATQTMPTAARRGDHTAADGTAAAVPVSRRLPAALAPRKRQLILAVVLVALLWAVVAGIALAGRDTGYSPPQRAPVKSTPVFPSVVTSAPPPVFRAPAPAPAPKQEKPHPEPKHGH